MIWDVMRIIMSDYFITLINFSRSLNIIVHNMNTYKSTTKTKNIVTYDNTNSKDLN